jgi:hypothetical protein
VLGVFRDAFRKGKDPSYDGPRALISEFCGLWIGCIFLIWSFTADGKSLQWTLRAVAAIGAIAGLGISAYFANTTEVPQIPDKEPSGFKSGTTSLHLR